MPDKGIAVIHLDQDDLSEEEFRAYQKLSGGPGVISSKVIPYEELDDETLEILYEQSPEFVMEHRPDYIRRVHPKSMQ